MELDETPQEVDHQRSARGRHRVRARSRSKSKGVKMGRGRGRVRVGGEQVNELILLEEINAIEGPPKEHCDK